MKKFSFSLVLLIALVAVAFVFWNPAKGQAQQRGQQQEQPLPALVNIKVLTGMTPAQVRTQMNAIRDQLGARCRYCHVNAANGVTDYIPETPMKDKAREMMRMVQVVNQQEPFRSGTTKVSCATCHKGSPKIPAFVPGGRETWVPAE
jgi:cytochrome c556